MLSIDMQFMLDRKSYHTWHGTQAAWHHDRYADR